MMSLKDLTAQWIIRKKKNKMKEMYIKEKTFGNMRNVVIMDRETDEQEELFCTGETAVRIAKKDNMIVIYEHGESKE